MANPKITALTMSVDQAARMLGISRGFAYELAKTNRLPGAIHLGGRIVVSRSKLEAAINGYGETAGTP